MALFGSQFIHSLTRSFPGGSCRTADGGAITSDALTHTLKTPLTAAAVVLGAVVVVDGAADDELATLDVVGLLVVGVAVVAEVAASVVVRLLLGATVAATTHPKTRTRTLLVSI